MKVDSEVSVGIQEEMGDVVEADVSDAKCPQRSRTSMFLFQIFTPSSGAFLVLVEVCFPPTVTR